MKNLKMRNGFSGYSLPATVASLSILFILNLSYSGIRITEKYEEHLDKAKKDLITVFNGVFYEDGYINSTIQPFCSNAQTTTDITAHRVVKCNDFRNIILKEALPGSETVPLESYILLLPQLNDGCQVYFSQEATNFTQMYAFFKCDLGVGAIDSGYVEGEWEYFFKTNYPKELIEIDGESINLDTAIGGTTSDGMIRFKFQK